MNDEFAKNTLIYYSSNSSDQFFKMACNRAIDAINERQWIPFSERQPDDGQEVIATVIADESKNLPKRVIMDCFMTVDLEWWQNNVTAWMPKPKAYEKPCEVAGVEEDKRC